MLRGRSKTKFAPQNTMSKHVYSLENRKEKQEFTISRFMKHYVVINIKWPNTYIVFLDWSMWFVRIILKYIFLPNST